MQSSLLLCDDPGDNPDDAPLPQPTLCGPKDGLTPATPKGWFKVMSYMKDAQTLDVGCWICALRTVQEAAYQHRPKKSYMVTRDEEGNRFLVVNPDLADECCDMIESFNSALMHCNCGGSDCLAGPEQFRAAQVFATRRWPSLTLSERIDILGAYEEGDDSIAIAMQGPVIVSTFEDTMLLMEIAGRI